VVRPAACTGHGWKKKEQSPAKEGKLTVGAVGVAGEGDATLAAAGRSESFWARWWLLALLLPPLLESRWQRRRFYRGERERSGATVT